MVSSMTAYSRLSKSVDWGHMTIEVQSLNRKHLEVNASLPKEFLFLDPEIKKEVQKKLFRGKVNFNLTFSFDETAKAFKLSPNLLLAGELKKGWDDLAKHLGIKDKDQGLTQLLCRENDLFHSEFDKSFLTHLKSEVLGLLDESLEDLIKMRRLEGKHLKEELLNRLDNLEKLLNKGSILVAHSSKQQQKKLKERVSELLDTPVESDDRMLKEIAILADKSDLTEEMTRISSHLKLFKKVLDEEGKSLGKTLDFITQELNREWNTIGSKCFDIETSHLVIDAKAECEKIREQVQNIE